MRKYLYLIILISISCELKENELFLKGYYFNPKNSLIYHFNKEKMETYNLIDSIHNSFVMSVKEKFIEIDYKKFKYKNYKNDSIIIYDYIENKENIFLIKFDFKEFDTSKLNNTDWLLNYKENKSKQYFKIVDTQGIYYSVYNKNLKKEVPSFNYMPLRAKYFDKFNIYLFTSIIVIGNYKEDKLDLLNINYLNGNKCEKIRLIKQNPKELNSLILGKWILIKEGKFNYSSYIQKVFNMENNNLSFDDKFNIVKERFEFNKIEFTNKQLFIRYFENKKTSCKVYTSFFPNYLFLDNIDFESFEINLLTKDSLSIKIPNNNLSYNFIRDYRDTIAPRYRTVLSCGGKSLMPPLSLVCN